jgi:large subunit ribosomal protein L13
MNTITREIQKIDATDKSLGRLASEIALILRGKDKPSWQPHIDGGDFVEITNAEKVRITGNKLNDKMYYRHSQYPGGLKERSLKQLIEKKGYEAVIKVTVYNMLPKNKLRNEMMKRLSVSVN